MDYIALVSKFMGGYHRSSYSGQAGEPYSCGANTTLAWHSLGIHPVEIRASGGTTVERFDQTSGLFDISPPATSTYHLFGYIGRNWTDLAADTVTVNAPQTQPGPAAIESPRRTLARNPWGSLNR